MKRKNIKKLEEKGLKIIESFISIIQVRDSKNNHEISWVKRFKFDKNTEKYFSDSEKKSSKELTPASDFVRIEVDVFYKVLIEDSIRKLSAYESEFEFDYFVVDYILNELKNLKNIKVTNRHFDPTEFTYTFYSDDMSRTVVIERSAEKFVYNIYITKTVNVKRYF